LTEEVIKHPKKVKSFSRVFMMDLAKIIRNLPISEASRAEVRRAFAEYFAKVDMFFDKKRFNDLAQGTLTSDDLTERYSHIKE